MFLADLEIEQAKSLQAGPNVLRHLKNKFEGAINAPNVIEQASLCREVMYVLRDHCPSHVKLETWKLVCEIIHNPYYFREEKPLKEGEWNSKKGRFLMKAVSIIRLEDARMLDMEILEQDQVKLPTTKPKRRGQKQRKRRFRRKMQKANQKAKLKKG